MRLAGGSPRGAPGTGSGALMLPPGDLPETAAQLNPTLH